MSTDTVRSRSAAAISSRNTSSNALEADVRPTCYYPDSSALEGGFQDRRGAPLKGHTLNEYLRMSPEQQAKTYVAVAMDSKIPYGTRMRIPELEQKMNGGRPINFKVVDTGGAFQGKGTGRMDICVENEKASHNPLLNQTDRPKHGLSPSIHAIFPDGLKAVSGNPGAPSTGGMLKKGSRGSEVTELQNQLNKLGCDVGAADGVFGPKTEAGVKKFQSAQGLEADGIVGPKTHEALKKALAHAAEPQDGFEPGPTNSGPATGVDGISAKGRQQMEALLRVAQQGSVGRRPDGLCLKHVGDFLDRVSYGKIGNGAAPRLPMAKDFGNWLNQNYKSKGLKKLNIDNPYKAPPGAIVVVRAGTPGTHHPTAGDIVVVGKNGHLYNGGEMGYGGPQNFPPGNKHVIGIFVPA